MTAKKSTLRSPIRWFGGKGHVAKKIVQFFPPHRIYVEPFGGGASLLFAKQPSDVEVYNDLDSGLVCLFRVLRDPRKFALFYEKVCWTPYSREEYEHCRDTWEDCEDEIERACRFFVIARQSFGGKAYRGWGSVITTSTRGMAETTSKWLSILHLLPAIHERLLRVQIEHNDFRTILDRYDTPETLFYCDPPYVPDTRRDGTYRHEMTLEDHRDLAGILLGVSGMVILSGYKHDVYRPLEESGWRRVDYKTSSFAAGRIRDSKIRGAGAATKHVPRVESIWISPTAQQRLEEREAQ